MAFYNIIVYWDIVNIGLLSLAIWKYTLNISRVGIRPFGPIKSFIALIAICKTISFNAVGNSSLII